MSRIVAFTMPLARSPALAVALLLGCRDVAEPPDSRACPQTYEFGNTGCTVIAGDVRGARNQPLAGISVGPRPSADGGQFNTPYVSTNDNGRFQLRLTRFASAVSEGASVWIRATVVPTPEERIATIFDSVLVRVRIAPVGQVPDTADVTIVLPVP
jgi:hypothetical protein